MGWPTGTIPKNSEIGVSNRTGVRISDDTALSISVFWSAVNLNASTIAAMPVGAFRKLGDVREPVNPTPELLVEPYPGISIQEFLSMGMVSLYLRGNFYGLIVARDSMLQPTAIQPLHPDVVIPPGLQKYGEPTNNYRVIASGGKRLEIDPFDMMHVRGLTLPGHGVGVSIIEYAANALGVSIATEEFGANFFNDGANPSGVLSYPDKLNDHEALAQQARFMRAHSGKHRKPAVLSGGVKWEQLSISPDEAQFLETRAFQREEILAWFPATPPHLVGDHTKNSTWGTGMETIGNQWLTFGLLPWITRWERHLSKYLPRPRYVKLNADALMRAKLLDRFQSYYIGRQIGHYSPNDTRRLEDQPPIPDDQGGNDYSKPLNWGPLGADPTEGDDDGSAGNPQE